MHVVLWQPEIPANTGNVARLCAVTGCHLHLVRPLGFNTDDRSLKRAGLDYWHLLDIHYYDDFDDFLKKNDGAALYLFTSKSQRSYCDARYSPDSFLVFGRETTGLSEEILARFSDRTVRIPMLPDPRARCLNLSNAVAVGVYEAFRQQKGFGGLSDVPTFHSGTLNSQY